jgi:hypothetical protein
MAVSMVITHYYAISFTNDQIANRETDNFYKDKWGNEIFEIIISTYNGIDFDDEFSELLMRMGK